MGKREEIDQLKHDYFMLSKRVDSLEHQLRVFMDGEPKDDFKPLAVKTLADVQKAWHEKNQAVLHGSTGTPPDIKHFEQKAHQPKINDNTKPPWIITAAEVAPRPYAHPCCED